MPYTIEKEPVTATRKGKYPWADLKVGESFVVPCVNLRSRQRSIRHSAATWAGRNDPARRFATRSEYDAEGRAVGIRVGRVS